MSETHFEMPSSYHLEHKGLDSNTSFLCPVRVSRCMIWAKEGAHLFISAILSFSIFPFLPHPPFFSSPLMCYPPSLFSRTCFSSSSPHLLLFPSLIFYQSLKKVLFFLVSYKPCTYFITVQPSVKHFLHTQPQIYTFLYMSLCIHRCSYRCALSHLLTPFLKIRYDPIYKWKSPEAHKS